MSAKLNIAATALLTAAFLAAAALLVIPTVPLLPILALSLSFLTALQALGRLPVAFLGGAVLSLLAVYGMDRLPPMEARLVPALVAVLWIALFLLHRHKSGMESRRHQQLLEQDESQRTARALKQEISFYEQRSADLARRAQQRRQLAEAARSLGALLDPTDIQTKLIETAGRMFPGMAVEISYGQSNDPADAFVVERRQPVLVPNDTIKGHPLIAAPITAQRNVAGILRVGGNGAGRFGQDELRLLDGLASLASIAMDNCVLFQQVQQTALRDHLTGLLTHRAFRDEMDAAFLEASRYSQPLSIITADIDHFKSINDTYGHQAGDQVLQGFAHVMDRNVRNIDVIARVGGEEFVIILFQTPHADAVALAERIRMDLEGQSFDAGSRTIAITGSFGVATFPEDGTSVQQLMRQGDQRLYASKSGGRNRVTGRR